MISDGLIRLSAWLGEVADIEPDIRQALERVTDAAAFGLAKE